MIAGIDPGATGAIAFRDLTTGHVVVFDLPTLAKLHGKGRILDGAAFASLVMSHKPTLAIIENQHAMPGQGVSSVFNLGLMYGGLFTALQILAVPIREVSPATWKKAAGLNGKVKEVSRALAINWHPEAAECLARKKDHNRAEAILISHSFTQ